MLTSAEGHIPNLRFDLADRPYIPDTRRGQSNCSSSRTLPFREASSRSQSRVTEKSVVLVVNLASYSSCSTAEEGKRWLSAFWNGLLSLETHLTGTGERASSCVNTCPLLSS